MTGRIVQINVSAGGLPKLPIPHATVRELGILGDDQRNKKYHGGPKQALLLIAAEVIDELAAEGWPLSYGSLGENLTTRGLDHRLWRPQQMFRVGGVVLALTKPRAPCVALNPYGPGIQERIYDKGVKQLDFASPHWGLSGFYASIIQSGDIATGDIIEEIDSVV
jgi:MOSC domain-containing protein YiiM